LTVVAQDTPQALLNEPSIAVLSTVGPGNRPHAAPIWFAYEDGEIVIITGARSQKARNIARNPEVAVTVDRRSPPYYAVMIQGTAEIGPRPSDDLRRRIAVRYLGEELGQRYLAMGTGEGSVTVRVRPRKIAEYKSPGR
jgi:PPOX class probable F420-dependent enzyme